MNILFVWKSPFKNTGGVGRVTEILAKQFVIKGHSVNYFSFSKGEEFMEGGIIQYFCHNPDKIDSDRNIINLAEILKKHSIGIIINQTGISDPSVLKTINSSVSIAERKNDTKVYSVHHNCVKCLHEHFELVVKENYRNSKLYPIISSPIVLAFLKLRHKKKYASIIRYLIEKSDQLVLLSDKFKEDLSVYLGKTPKNGVKGILNPAPFKPQDTESEKENRLIYVGRINFQQKRSDLLIPVWKEIMERHPDWKLDVLGDGEALPELKKMAENAQLERIYFHGFQDPKPFLSKAKYFVLTSAFEGFGMVLVEAQAYGVIPIAFNCFSAIDDIIDDGITGALVEPFNIDKYVDKLDSLIKNEKFRPEMAQYARQSIEKFKPEKIADEWLEMFES